VPVDRSDFQVSFFRGRRWSLLLIAFFCCPRLPPQQLPDPFIHRDLTLLWANPPLGLQISDPFPTCKFQGYDAVGGGGGGGGGGGVWGVVGWGCGFGLGGVVGVGVVLVCGGVWCGSFSLSKASTLGGIRGTAPSSPRLSHTSLAGFPPFIGSQLIPYFGVFSHHLTFPRSDHYLVHALLPAVLFVPSYRVPDLRYCFPAFGGALSR